MKDSAQKIEIVVIEDHFVTLDGLVTGLSNHEGFSVVGSSANFVSGLDLVDKFHPQIVVLDLHLPDVTSPTAMIKEFLRVTDVKLIIFSAEMRMAYVQEVLSLGVSAYLLKSERVATVIDAIQRVAAGEKRIFSEQIGAEFKKITPAEQEVLHMLGKGMKYQEIADRRSTSITTARKQCEILVMKLGLETREQLIAWAVENGYGSRDLYA